MNLIVDIFVWIICEIFLNMNKPKPVYEEKDSDMAAFFFGARPSEDGWNNQNRPHINEDYDEGPNW